MLLEWYILAVISFALSFDQHRSMMMANARIQGPGLLPLAIDASAWIGGIATIGLLIAGFFIGAWWWPLLAMAMGTGVNYMGRLVMPMDFRWISSLGGVLIGSTATAIVLT